MMHIDFKTPDLPQDQTARAQKLVAQMRTAVGIMQKWTEDPGSRFKVMTAENRKQLRERGLPELLAANAAVFTEQVRRLMGEDYVESDEIMVGFTSDAFDSSLYASPAIRRWLIQSHVGRCAYCETLIDQSAYGDVEHFRPKAGYTVPPSPALVRPGYYELAYEPSNLFLSCQLCNEAYKQNEFPVIGSRAPAVALNDEVPVLIDPYREDPRGFIRFNPMNGQAYAFDLVKAFYAQARGWGPPEVESQIWKDPALIPGQVNMLRQPISNPEVDAKFQLWLSGSTDQGILIRGTRTIGILNLNRRSLVRARINQLRQLRSIGLVAGIQAADQQAAQKLITSLLGNDPTRAALAPEYLSLSIDALQTWRVNSQIGSIDSYDEALQVMAHEKVLDIAPPPGNDALMYLVLESEYKDVGKRRIVYLTDADRVYGSAKGQTDGIFLAIDWSEELDNAVKIVRGDAEELTTLRELISGAPQHLWRTFQNSAVWALGKYDAIKPG